MSTRTRDERRGPCRPRRPWRPRRSRSSRSPPAGVDWPPAAHGGDVALTHDVRDEGRKEPHHDHANDDPHDERATLLGVAPGPGPASWPRRACQTAGCCLPCDDSLARVDSGTGKEGFALHPRVKRDACVRGKTSRKTPNATNPARSSMCAGIVGRALSDVAAAAKAAAVDAVALGPRPRHAEHERRHQDQPQNRRPADEDPREQHEREHEFEVGQRACRRAERRPRAGGDRRGRHAPTGRRRSSWGSRRRS